MKTKSALVATFLSMIGLLFFCGCGSPIQTISLPDKTKIHSIYVSSNLGKEFQFAQLGATNFTMQLEIIPDDAGLLAGVSTGMQKVLESRGYTIAKEAALADAVLDLQPGAAGAMRTQIGAVVGAGFQIQRAFGLYLATIVTARIDMQLRDPKTSVIMASASAFRYEISPIKKDASKWSAFTESEQNALMKALNDQLLTVPEDGVKQLGL